MAVAPWSSADLLRRCQRAAQLPADDEAMTADAWYDLLTSAQAEWYPELAAHVPHVLYSAPRQLTSFDGGRTYRFGDDVDGRPVMPVGEVQVFRSERDASQPEGASAWSLRAGDDFIAEGDLLRMRTTGGASVFPEGGPWVRVIDPPGVIDADHEPVLLPTHARKLLVFGAVEEWATQGGLRDPSPWIGRARKVAYGDPSTPGSVGLIAALKLQYPAPASAGRFQSPRFPGTYLWGRVR
jgi:hypothetical protein